MDTNINVLASVAVIVSITIALVQVIKNIDDKNKYARFYPLLSLIIGGVLGMLFKFDLLNSLIIGLSAAGVYDVGKYTLKMGDEKNK